MATNYSRGYSAENKCVNELKANGWVAMRTAGSHGPADVVAANDNYTLFIQVKKVRNEKGVKAALREGIEEISQMPRTSCCRCGRFTSYREVWVRVHGQRDWAVQICV